MYFRYIKLKLQEIRLWRWFLLVAFFGMITFFDIQSFAKNNNPSFVETVILELNNYFNICYYFLFAIIIISSDIFNCSKEVFYDQVFIKLGTRKKYIKANSIYIAVLSLITLLIFIIITFIIYMIIYKGLYSIHSNNMEIFGLPNLSIVSGFLLSFSLVICRLIFLNASMFLINIKLNYPVGFLFVFFISLLDWWFYEVFQIMEPLFILPIEHTRIFYTEAVAPAMQTVSRVGYNVSYIYWIALIVIEALLLWRVILKKDFITREYIN